MRRIAAILKTLPSLLVNRIKGDQTAFTEALFDLFISMGGVYTKFLQILVLNTDMLNSVSFEKRQRVFSKTPPSKLNIHELLGQELPVRYKELIPHIVTTPFATGSFANVYKGVLSDGQQVIIKALRPGIKPSLKFDLPAVRFFANLWGSFGSSRHNLSAMAHEYTHAIKREVNYRHEVRNAQQLFEDYSHNPHIIIPKSYPELSSRHVIVQEYLDGILFEDLQHETQDSEAIRQKAYQLTGSDLFVQLEHMGYDLMTRLFEGRVIHGDIHPGNVMLLPENKIAYLDFGLIATPIKDRTGYFEYIKEQITAYTDNLRAGKLGMSIFRVNSGELYNAFKVLDGFSKNSNDQSLLSKVEGLIANTFEESPVAQNMRSLMKQDATKTITFFDSAMNLAGNNRLSLKLKMDGVLARRSANSWVKLIRSVSAGNVILPSVYSRSINSRGSLNIANTSKYSQSIEHALEVVTNWLEDLATSDIILFRQVRKAIQEAGYNPSVQQETQKA